jgi:hypothetical protein
VKKYELTGGNIINVIHFAGIQAVKKHGTAIPKDISSLKEECTENGVEAKEEISSGENKLHFFIDDVIEGIRREMNKEGKPFTV